MSTVSTKPPEKRKPFWVKCEPCDHCWAPAYYPMEVAAICKLLTSAKCPMCGTNKRVVVAKQNGGVLNEPSALIKAGGV